MNRAKYTGLGPEPDETIMSFLRRQQDDQYYSDEEFELLVASFLGGGGMLAERRDLDWSTLSEVFGIDREQLFQMSQRSLFARIDQPIQRSVMLAAAPWLRGPGYPCWCPECLRERTYWRRDWLSPVATVCTHHSALLLRHCPECHGELGQMSRPHAGPLCPDCGFHLSLAREVRCPARLMGPLGRLQAQYRALDERRPILVPDEMRFFAAVCIGANAFGQAAEGKVRRFGAKVLRSLEFDPATYAVAGSSRALQFALSVLVAEWCASTESGVRNLLGIDEGRASGSDRSGWLERRLADLIDEDASVDCPDSVWKGQLHLPFGKEDAVEELRLAA